MSKIATSSPEVQTAPRAVDHVTKPLCRIKDHVGNLYRLASILRAVAAGVCSDAQPPITHDDVEASCKYLAERIGDIAYDIDNASATIDRAVSQ
jgi:hypothetical protein